MMKRGLKIASTFFVCAWIAAPAALAETYTAIVVGVTDGDTIKVLHDGRTESVRLAQIDCPEKRQPYGNAAKQLTAKLVFRTSVLIHTVDTDRYGRSIAQVEMHSGQSLNRELVKRGYAWHYVKYSSDADLQLLQDEAKLKKRGLWQSPNMVPPWSFRKICRRQKNITTVF